MRSRNDRHEDEARWEQRRLQCGVPAVIVALSGQHAAHCAEVDIDALLADEVPHKADEELRRNQLRCERCFVHLGNLRCYRQRSR